MEEKDEPHRNRCPISFEFCHEPGKRELDLGCLTMKRVLLILAILAFPLQLEHLSLESGAPEDCNNRLNQPHSQSLTYTTNSDDRSEERVSG